MFIGSETPEDVHLINYGMILDDEVIYASNEAFEQVLQIVEFTSSFSSNLHDGRLSRISHEHDNQRFTTLVHPRRVGDRMVTYVVSGSDSRFPASFQRQILDNFAREVESTIPVKKIARMYHDHFADFTLKMIQVADKIDRGIALIHDMEEVQDNFLIKDRDNKETRIHYIGISTSGIPVRNYIYGKHLVSLFKIPQKENVEPEEILRSLISAQFSAIINSSLIKAGTSISEFVINYTGFENLESKQLRIAFFPMGFQDQYSLEICYDGSQEDIFGFKEACINLMDKYFQAPFRGSLKDFELVADLLQQLPDNFSLFGGPASNVEEDLDMDDDELPGRDATKDDPTGSLKLNFSGKEEDFPGSY